MTGISPNVPPGEPRGKPEGEGSWVGGCSADKMATHQHEEREIHGGKRSILTGFGVYGV